MDTRPLKKILTNKWFLLIGLPIIFLFILYTYLSLSYGKETADVVAMAIVVGCFIGGVIFLMPLPKRKKELSVEDLYHQQKAYNERLGQLKAEEDYKRRQRRW